MSIKDLFEKQKENSISLKGFAKSTIDQFTGDVESANYIEQKQIYAQTFIPDLDYSSASNFVKFGSAEKYYQNSIDRITNEYPYDGSKAEKLEYYNTLNPLEKYIFDNEYPRTTGYVNFAPNGWGTQVSSLAGVGLPTTKEYISFYNQSVNNVYDLENNRRENTRFIFSSGSTIEFWMKKDAFANKATQTRAEAVFYMKTTGSTDKNYFLLYTDYFFEGPNYIIAEYSTGAGIIQKFNFVYDTGLVTIADSNWHHYAFTFYSSSAGYTSEFYFDGVYKEKKTQSGTILNFTGSAFCMIGAMGGPSSLTAGDAPIGSAKLSGSIDEFRFWNTRRTAKEIGINYFTHVGGGTNTDLANVELGVYYKFNEGITGNSSTDSVVLDYAGRVCNGTFTGYNIASRSTGSAIDTATTSVEPADPIIYSTHPDVVTYAANKQVSGSFYDASNPSSLINSMPRWILDEDDGDTLKNFLQVLASYLDTLYLQISNLNKLKNISYQQNNVKQNPFNNKLLTSLGFDTPDLFINSDILKSIFDQDDKRLFEEKISDIKNQIYKNIYNNLLFINKSKGTEKAFRNLVRCFGADDNLFKLTIYANNSEYKYQDKYTNVGVKKAYLDMTEVVDSQNKNAVIYQYPETGNANSQGYIAQSLNYNIGATLEAEIVFPSLIPTYNNPLLSPSKTFVSQSLFGMHKADAGNPTNTTYFAGALDLANVQIYSVTRDDITKFVITSSLGLYGETSFIKNVYNNSRWNLSFRFRPTEYPFVSGTVAASSYTVDFHGYNYDSGELLNSFTSSFTVTTASGNNFQLSPKRIYAGAHRQNITGSVLTSTNIKLLSVRYWSDYLLDDEIKIHARDIANFGRNNPFENSFVYENGQGTVYIPRIDTLSLYWDFETLSTSDATGSISSIPDVKSASIGVVKYPTEYNNLVGYQHTGKGSFFANSFQVKNNEYYNSSQIQIPENVNSDDLIQILEQDDEKVTSETLPESLFFSVESSMYDVISRKALEFFSTINDFNNLVGEPVNQYRLNYKDLTKLRQLFFEKVENQPDLDKYVGLYKWVDDALEGVLANLIPASANASEKVRTIVENHVLERNKYQYSFIPSGSLPNKVTQGSSVGGGSKPIQAADPPYFNDATSESSYVGSNTNVIDIVGGIITPYPPMPHDFTKVKTNPKQKQYIDSVYVSRPYTNPPSAERQKTGFDPAANYRFNRADTNLIDSTVDATVQENTRKSSLNVPKREMTKAVKFSNDSVTTTIRPTSAGSLGNTNVGFYRTKLNTDSTTSRIILTPDSKQVFLSDDSVQQQTILFQENND